MRGKTQPQFAMFVPVNVEQRIEAHDPVRLIKISADYVLRELDEEFNELYSGTGRPSIPPEYLLKALLWQGLFSIRSERQLMEVVAFDLKCRWFIGLPHDVMAWDASTFSKARERLLLLEISALFFERLLGFLRDSGLVDSQHLTVDGTLLGAWASHKSFVPKKSSNSDDNAERVDNGWGSFRRGKRSNDTHASITDPDARLCSRGAGAHLRLELNLVTENSNNFAVGMNVCSPTGYSEAQSAVKLIAMQVAGGFRPTTVGADRKYSHGNIFIDGLDALGVVPHAAVRRNHPNEKALAFQKQHDIKSSLKNRMRIEGAFGYVKTIVGLAKLKVRGVVRALQVVTIALSCWNLRRLSTLASA